MPKFSRKSAARLVGCHSDLATLFHEVVKATDCTVICGARGKEEQEEAVRTGHSKARWPFSLHNVDGATRRTSWAADVVPYPIDWNDRQRFAAFAAVVIETAERLRAANRMRYAVRWGGDWDGDGDWRDERFLDMPHYELVGVKAGE
jgi:peptidoglycan L-alanyl-D-glutamate endopeptidase CwlK